MQALPIDKSLYFTNCYEYIMVITALSMGFAR